MKDNGITSFLFKGLLLTDGNEEKRNKTSITHLFAYYSWMQQLRKNVKFHDHLHCWSMCINESKHKVSMKLKAKLSEQGENFPGKASWPLCPAIASQRLKHSVLSCMPSRLVLPLVTTSLSSRSTRSHPLYLCYQSLLLHCDQHLMLTNGGEQEEQNQKAQLSLIKAWTSHNLHVSQRTWVLSHCPCSLLVMAGTSTARSLFPSLEI